MPGQRHIGEVPVHGRGGEDEGLVNGDALAFVDRRGIAVVDVGVGRRIERDGPAAIERDCQHVVRRRDDGSEHAVLDGDGIGCAGLRRQAAVFEKQDAVTGCKRPQAARSDERLIACKIATIFQCRANGRVQRQDIGVTMRQDQRFGLPTGWCVPLDNLA